MITPNNFQALIKSCLALCCLLIVGCGQTGPLYLPKPPPPPSQTQQKDVAHEPF